jgi:hypothetical protein
MDRLSVACEVSANRRTKPMFADLNAFCKYLRSIFALMRKENTRRSGRFRLRQRGFRFGYHFSEAKIENLRLPPGS